MNQNIGCVALEFNSDHQVLISVFRQLCFKSVWNTSAQPTSVLNYLGILKLFYYPFETKLVQKCLMGTFLDYTFPCKFFPHVFFFFLHWKLLWSSVEGARYQALQGCPAHIYEAKWGSSICTSPAVTQGLDNHRITEWFTLEGNLKTI